MSGLKESQHLKKIPLEDIELATENFKTVIGRGGYGQVYRGELSISGKPTTVAVKRLNEQFGQGLKEFLTEIQLLSGQNHPNLISLLGYCEEGKEKIIIYEYAERGSLDRYLRSGNTTDCLTWLQRLRICVDAARGLEHLHNHVGKHQTIIHRDIKSANILIDHNWVAKISDLGLSKLCFAGLNRSAVISHPCGTLGYCEPEYFITGIVKKESDVYSFGMVLFEVLCGRLCKIRDHDGILLSGLLAKDYYEKKKLDQIIDPRLREQMSLESKNKFSAIAYRCVQDDRGDRPPMDLVVKELQGSLEIQVLERVQKKSHRQVELLSPIPKPPAEEPKVPEEKEAPKPEGKKEEPPQVITVVLKVNMHCEACAQEIRKRILRMKGVENAEPDLKSSQLSVKGTFEAQQLVDYVHKITGKHAVVVKQDPDPIPKPPAEEPKVPEEKEAPKPEEKKEEPPQVITVVLKVYMHCDGCAQEIRKHILRMKGVENAKPDVKSSQLSVKGTFEAQQLVDYVYKRTGKHAVVVKQDPEPKKEDNKGKDEKKDGGGKDGGEKKEEKKAEDGGGGAEGKEEEKEKEGGGEEAAKPEAAGAAGGGAEDMKVVELRKNEFYYYHPQNYEYAAESAYGYRPTPQMFSDENPNACSVM